MQFHHQAHHGAAADMGHMKKWRKSLQVQLDAVHQTELGHWLDKYHPVPKPYAPNKHCSTDTPGVAIHDRS